MADILRSYDLGGTGFYPVAAGATVDTGSAVGLTSSGYARKLQPGDSFLGFAILPANNSGGQAGEINLKVRRRGRIRLPVSGAGPSTPRGTSVFATDDDTFTLSSSGSVYIGTLAQHVSGSDWMVNFNIDLKPVGSIAAENAPLPINKGGTGSASPSLVAGSNITISGAWPNQTINALISGSGSPIYRSDLGSLTVTSNIVTTAAYSPSHPPCAGYWKWQAGSPASWDISAIAGHPSVGGYWVQFFPDGVVTAEHFGAKGDYDLVNFAATTYDNDAIKAGFAAAIAYGLPFETWRPNAIEHVNSTPTKAIRIPNGLRWRFRGNGCIVHPGAVMHPWFWAEGNALDIQIDNPNFFFAGTIDRNTRPDTLYATSWAYWFDNEISRPTNTPCADIGGLGDGLTPLFIAGGDKSDIRIKTATFRSIGPSFDTTNNHKMMQSAITLLNANDGTKTQRVMLDGCYFDLVQMGILAVGFKNLEINNLVSDRYGYMNVAWSSAPPPPHLVYCSNTAARDGSGNVLSDTVILRNPVDYGRDLSEWNNTQCSLKFRGPQTVHIDGGRIDRPHGVIDGAVPNWRVKLNSGRADFVKCQSASAGAVMPLRLLPDYANGGEIDLGNFEMYNCGAALAKQTAGFLDLQNLSGLKLKGKIITDDFKARALFGTPSVANAGSGGTPGAVTLTGSDGTGTKFVLTGTIAGDGTLSAITGVTNYGNYSADPSSLTAAPVTGGGLSGATVNINSVYSTSGLIKTTTAYNCDFEIDVACASNIAYSSPAMANVNTNATDNDWRVRTRNWPLTGMRFIQNTKSAMTRNTYRVRDVSGGGEREIRDGLETQWLYKEVTLTASGAATLTASSFIPANAEVLSLVSIITTALSGGGVTGYQVGDGSTASLWGSVSATAAGNGTSAANWHASTPTQSAQNVVVTFTGGSPSSGAVKLRLWYRLSVRNTDTYYTG